MAVRPIVRLGHPALRTPAEALDPGRLDDPEIQTLIDEMLETMTAGGGVGLAAPQLGIGLQLCVYAAVVDPDRPDAAGAERKALVNPALEPVHGELVYDWEGCLSVPDLRGVVPRLTRLRLEALDREGNPFSLEASGFFARVVQHECDHLDGQVYLDRMKDMRSLTFIKEFEDHVLRDEGES